MNTKEFNKILEQVRQDAMIPGIIVVNTKVWNGYWSIIKRPKLISKIFRWIGRKLKSRKIYWFGLSIFWQEGLKNFFPENSWMESKALEE